MRAREQYQSHHLAICETDSRFTAVYSSHLCSVLIAGEWGWALHRMPFWMNMAWAYQQTADEKYAQGFKRQCLDWLRRNPRDPRFEYDWYGLSRALVFRAWWPWD